MGLSATSAWRILTSLGGPLSVMKTGTSARAMEGIRVSGDYSRPACYPPGMSRVLVLLLAGSLLASCAVFEPIGNFLAEAKALGFEPHLNQS